MVAFIRKMMPNSVLKAGILFIFLVVVRGQSCTPPANPEFIDQLARYNNLFLYKFYKTINTSENVVFSIFNIRITGLMIKEGAEGNTNTQLRQGLQVKIFGNDSNIKIAVLDAFNTVCINSFYTLRIIRTIYVSNNFPVEAVYKNVTSEYYQTDVHNADFSNNNNQVESAINDFISQKTEGRINNFYSCNSFNASTALVVASATFFTGNWKIPFDPRKTTAAPFTTNTGENVTVSMMKTQGEFVYYHNSELSSTVLKLDYEGDNKVLIIILPDVETSLSQVQSKLNATLIQSVVEANSSASLNVAIPRFDISWKKDIKENFEELGMRDVFKSGVANLSGISNTPGLYVSYLSHAFRLTVNEGSSNATANQQPLTPNATSFTVDRPFIIAVYDKPLRSIFVFGHVLDPSVG